MKFLLWAWLAVAPLALAHAAEKSSAGKTYGAVIVTEIGTIYDGDTFYVNIANWPAIVGEHIAVRVNGVDTPELKGKCDKEIKLARQAKQFTVSFLRNAKFIELKSISRDKYFRIGADVYGDGKSLSRELIKNRLGYAYHGASKKNWCE